MIPCFLRRTISCASQVACSLNPLDEHSSTAGSVQDFALLSGQMTWTCSRVSLAREEKEPEATLAKDGATHATIMQPRGCALRGPGEPLEPRLRRIGEG
jgi:hypothetical protein